MRAVRACTFTILVGVVVSCDAKAPPRPPPGPVQTNDSVAMLWGIDPRDWTCDRVATVEQMIHALGGPVRIIATPMEPAPGTPQPCTFVLEGTAPETWSFDLDCRPNALGTAATLFSQYAAMNEEQIQAFDAASGGKVLTDDAGVEQHAVAAPQEVAVGKRALDHHGMQILFIDDDAPCYARVSGSDPDRRLRVAKLVATNLTPMNAPMRPYPAPTSVSERP